MQPGRDGRVRCSAWLGALVGMTEALKKGRNIGSKLLCVAAIVVGDKDCVGLGRSGSKVDAVAVTVGERNEIAANPFTSVHERGLVERLESANVVSVVILAAIREQEFVVCE